MDANGGDVHAAAAMILLSPAEAAEPASVHVSEERQICHVSEERQIEEARHASLMQASHDEYFAQS